MSKEKIQNPLTHELESLFDLKKSRTRDEKILTQQAYEAQKDIRYLTMMFCDGIPEITMPVNDHESIKWDAKGKQLLYIKNNHIQILEATSRDVMVRMRPFLTDLVRKAKEFYSDN